MGFVPGGDPNTATDPNIAAQFGTFLQDPRIAAAALSGGLSLMTPQWGNNPVSSIAQAIGAGGTSAQVMDEQARKDAEAESKSSLREAQAGAAEARAGHAGANASNAASRLELEREKMNSLNDRNALGNRIRAANLYQNYVKDVNKRNSDIGRDVRLPPEPILPIGDWVKANPMIQSLLPPTVADTGDTADDTDTAVAPVAPTGRVRVNTPAEAMKLQAGTKYVGPDGIPRVR